MTRILADIIYDPLTPDEKAANGGELVAHYQVSLIDGNDVYTEYKSGTYTTGSYASQIWGESKFTWQNGQLVWQWSYASDWKAPGSAADFWEPVFHAALARDSVFVPGAHGSTIQLDKATGAAISRIAPFGTDPNTWQTGPITVDSQGNLYYSAIQVTVDPVSGFFGNDATDSWLVKVIGSSAAVASYKTLTSPDAPGPTGQCVTGFSASQPPWPPNADAVPPTSPCGTQRVALHVAPAVGPDGAIYSVTRAHFNDR